MADTNSKLPIVQETEHGWEVWHPDSDFKVSVVFDDTTKEVLIYPSDDSEADWLTKFPNN